MKRLAISLSEATDLENARAKIRSILPIADPMQASFISQVEQTLHDLAKQGAELAALGSAFHATRTMEAGGFSVTITADYGRKPSLLRRLFGS